MKNRLKVLRAENNLTQEQLAQSVGVSRQAINAIETEKYDPSLPLAIKLGKLFGKPVEEMFFVDEDEAKINTSRKPRGQDHVCVSEVGRMRRMTHPLNS